MISIELHEDDREKLKNYIGVQSIYDTMEIVDKYNLKDLTENYEASLQELYDLLNNGLALNFSEEDAIRIIEFIGEQDLLDTMDIVECYDLDGTAEYYDSILQELYDKLYRELKCKIEV